MQVFNVFACIASLLTVLGLQLGTLLVVARWTRAHPKQIAICAASMCLPPLMLFLIWGASDTEIWFALAIVQSMMAFAFVLHLIPWVREASRLRKSHSRELDPPDH